MKHPMQEIIVAPDHVVRFRENPIVRLLLDTGKLDLNDIARMRFDDEDRMQFAQLIGYSVSGYGDLSYASEESVTAADVIADKLWVEHQDAEKLAELTHEAFCDEEDERAREAELRQWEQDKGVTR